MTNYEHLVLEQQILTKEIAALKTQIDHAPKAGLIEHMVFGNESPLQKKLNSKMIELKEITKKILIMENEIMNKSYINNSMDFLALQDLKIYQEAKHYYNKKSVFAQLWDKLNTNIEFEQKETSKKR